MTPSPHRRLRDILAAAVLLIGAASTVCWQNARIGVLWDLSYLLDSSWRIALGQMPYRDFPFAHAPLTFLTQAVIIKLTGRVFFHHVIYAALASALGTLLAWRIILRTLTSHEIELTPQTWWPALALALPLTVLGVYGIYPTPYYDPDAALAVLLTIFLIQKSLTEAAPPRWLTLTAGASLVLPLFYKQNIGLPFLAVALLGLPLFILLQSLRLTTSSKLSRRTLAEILLGTVTTLAASATLLHFTAGIHAYIHWTVTFAAQRRLPPLSDILAIYTDDSLLITLPCVVGGIALLCIPSLRFKTSTLGSPHLGSFEMWFRRIPAFWMRFVATTLLAVPFLRTLLLFFLQPDSDDRTSNLLSLWPIVLILAATLTVVALIRRQFARAFLLLLLLAAIHGTLLSQELWGSTYAIWPLLILLIAALLAELTTHIPSHIPAFVLSATIAVTLLLCGTAYVASEERLSYANVLEGAPQHSTLLALRGLTVRGPSLPAFDQLVRFTQAEIPASDGLILLNGEDPFYFATGRTPQFPVLLFDPATDPLTPAQTLAEARARNIHWLIVKRALQAPGDPMPNRPETLTLLLQDFHPYRQLDNYDIYRR